MENTGAVSAATAEERLQELIQQQDRDVTEGRRQKDISPATWSLKSDGPLCASKQPWRSVMVESTALGHPHTCKAERGAASRE